MEDRYWSYQKQRVCFHFPELSPLFEENSYAKKKRKKSEWSIPRKGTWWVFKRYLSLGFDMKGSKELCKKEDTRALAIAVVSLNIPMRELITKHMILPNPKKGGPNYSMYRISFWTPSVRNPGNRCTFIIRHGSNYFDHEFYYIPTGETYNEINERRDSRLFKDQDFFGAWKSFLFQKDYISCWNDLFVDLIQNKITV
jgi:hypothetical protein